MSSRLNALVMQELEHELKSRQISRQTLGEQCGVTTNTINRWLDPARSMKLAQLEKICDGLGWEVVIRTKEGKEMCSVKPEPIPPKRKYAKKDRNI